MIFSFYLLIMLGQACHCGVFIPKACFVPLQFFLLFFVVVFVVVGFVSPDVIPCG